MKASRFAIATAMLAIVAAVLVPSAANADSSQTTTWNFDNSAVGTVPSGCSTPTGRAAVLVSSDRAPAGATHSALLTESGSALSSLLCSQPATASASLSFQVYPQQLANGFLLDLTGNSTDGAQSPTSSPLVHLLFAAGGAVKWYNGSAWQTIATSGGPAVGTWSTIQVSVGVGSNSASVAVNGSTVGVAQSERLNPLTGFTGVMFSGYGTSYTGDTLYFGSPTVTGTTPVHTMSWNLQSGAVGSVPSNCVTPSGRSALTISSAVALPGSSHSLQMTETGGDLPVIDCTATSGTVSGVGADLRFAADPTQLAHGFMVDLAGTTSAGTAAADIFHILFKPDGSVSWYDGYASNAWRPLAPSGGPAIGQWSTIDIATTSDMDMAYVTVNGHYLGSGGSRRIDPAASITGFQFAGYGTGMTGDTVYFGSPGLFPALSSRPAQVTSQYQIGATTTVASEPGSATSPMQFPSTVVQVPGTGGGQRLIALYSHTPDSSTATPNAVMVYSDDGGATWQTAGSSPSAGIPSNPMTNGNSLVRLSNGTLLEATFHTYTAVPGSSTSVASNQALIETAVSSDNGQTWSAPRYTTLTSTQGNINRVSCETASPCAALYLTHGPIEGPDGTLYLAAYANFAADGTKDRQVVLKSVDGGLDWTIQGTVALPSSVSNAGFNEGAISWASNGDMVAVMRTGSYEPMYFASSSDDGATWSSLTEMTSPNGSPVVSVDPNIVQLGDGSLLLEVGRPGISLLHITYSGGQYHWAQQTWIDYNDSGYAAMTVTGGNQVIIVGDRGQNWVSLPQTMGIWSRTVDVVG